MSGDIKLSNLNECPFCRHDEFMYYGIPTGKIKYKEKFNGQYSDNADMYNSVSFVPQKSIYCAGCGAYLGNAETNRISKRAKIVLGLVKMI